MPDPLGTPQVSNALIEALGLKGRYGVQLDDILIPGCTVINLDRSPFAIAKPFVEDRSEAAVVANYTGTGIMPAENTILELTDVVLTDQVGAIDAHSLYRITPGDLATLTITDQRGLRDLSGYSPGATGQPRLPSQSIDVQHATRLTTRIITVYPEVNLAATVHFPYGYMLRGNDPHGIFGLIHYGTAVNTAARATFHGREWTIVR